MISVIVPIYYGRSYIKQMIHMIEKNAGQISEPVELIFVNDSPDEQIEDLCTSSCIEIVLINNSENKGIHYSRVQGVLASRGEYLLMLDQDDCIREGFLSSQRAKIKNADMIVANGFEELEEGKRILYKYRLMQWTVKYSIFHTLFGCRIISPGQCLIRRKSIPKKWCQDIVKHNGADDYLLWLYLFSRRAKIRLNRETLYIHRYTGANTSSDSERMNESLREVIEIARKNRVMSASAYRYILKKIYGRKTVFSRMMEGIVKVGNRVNRGSD